MGVGRGKQKGIQESIKKAQALLGVETGRIMKGNEGLNGNASSKKMTRVNTWTYYQGMEPVTSQKAPASACCVTMLDSPSIRVQLALTKNISIITKICTCQMLTLRQSH